MVAPQQQFRTEWIKCLTGHFKEIQKKLKDRPIRVGISGALGSSDVGDEAMLIALLAELRLWNPRITVVIFSKNPRMTTQYTGLNCLPDLQYWAYHAHQSLPRLIRLSDMMESKLVVLSRRIVRIRETLIGGFALRVASMLLGCAMKILIILSSPRRLSGCNGVLREHIKNLASLDAFVLLGGGYLNSWQTKGRGWLWLISADIAHSFGVPLFGSGLNLGPFNAIDLRRTSRTLRDFKLIGLRDRRESIHSLRDMGIYNERIHRYSGDDATNLPCVDLPPGSLELSIVQHAPYIAVHAHKWLMDRSAVARLQRIFADVIDMLTEKTTDNIALIPMTFGDRKTDQEVLDGIKSSCKRQDRVFLIKDALRPGQLKLLFANARCSLVTRHHAMVFSVSSGIPSVAVVFDSYYRAKLHGVAEEYSSLCTLLPFETLTSAAVCSALENLLNTAVANGEICSRS